jgi:cytochrome P450
MLLTRAALRLYPPVPVNTRTATQNTVLPTGGGLDGRSPVLVPKGSSVALSIYSMHRRPDLYGMDAALFRPERWEEDMPFKHDPVRAKWSYIPFHSGPRSCPGSMFVRIVHRILLTNSTGDFALTEAGYTVVRLLQTFSSIELPPGERVTLVGHEKQDATLVLKIDGGCNVRLAR